MLNPAQANIYVLNGKGVLQCHTAIGDPAHLLLEVPGYDLNNHEVLARFRVADFGLGDGPRGGIAVAVMVDPTSQGIAIGQGINLHFRNNPENGSVNNHHLNFLDDRRAWQGSVIDNNWSVGTWYWVRVKRELTGGSPLTSGKVWPADGTTQEPIDWDNHLQRSQYTPPFGLCRHCLRRRRRAGRIRVRLFPVESGGFAANHRGAHRHPARDHECDPNQ